MERISPADGTPLYIGYGDLIVQSPDTLHATDWKYDGEPPHGDSLNVVHFNGLRLPGRYWGRGHAWSPNSDYFTVEREDRNLGGLYVVRVADSFWYKVADFSASESFVFPELSFRRYEDNSPIKRYVFSGKERWAPIG